MSSRILSILLVFLGFAIQLRAQSVPFDKKNFPDKEVLNKAMEALAEGDNYYGDDYAVNFDSALKYFEIAQAINPNNAELNLKIGRCHLDLPSGKEHMACLPFFQKALALDPEVDGIIYLYIGKAYHLNSEWSKAIVEYSKFQEKLDDKTQVYEIELVGKKIQECRNGKELSKTPIKAEFKNMGDWMNTVYREHSPIIASNESVMYFTGRLPNTTGKDKDLDALYFEDIYVTYNTKGGWSKPRNLGSPVNTIEHDATVSLSADGTNMIIMRDGDLYFSELKGASWSDPTPFPKEINGKKTDETAASYADDGNIIYFISDREPSIGGKDIWVSQKDGLGNWSEAKNLGDVINTKYDENGIFMHPDGTTFFFSSEGHNSIGGTDLFKSIYNDRGWSTPVNLGIPLNTPSDEQCLVVSADYRNGYYSSKGKDTYGDHDIYKVTFFEVERPLEMIADLEPTSLFQNGVEEVKVEGDVAYAILSGKITDFNDNSPLDATLSIKNRKNNEIVKKISTNASNGSFMVALPLDLSYEVTVRANGYLYFAEDFKEFGKVDLLNTLNAKIKKIIPNQTVVLKNVLFKRASDEMLPESYEELNRLVQIMIENPGIEIEIGGHTDNIGNPAKLIRLSRKRMESVRDYLIARGISSKRLKGIGYGGSKPIADNSDSTERAKNRRVDFKILKVK